MSVLSLLIASLAVWRTAHILLRENGPWRVFRAMREVLGVRYYDPESDDVASFRYEITVCIWCLSVWVGALATIALWFVPNIAFWVMLPFAFSTVTVLLERVAHKLK